ncbi:MAG TPA: SLC13/DASS family transporter [Phycisphaeraceae bacterium]|nr:SLC13/DASS family transporter [Phycisphaeraceae bacterium]
MSRTIRLTALVGGPVIALCVVLFADLQPGRPEVTMTAAVALLMAIWWITEVVPLAVTSLLPVVLLPALGVMNGKEVSVQYFNWVIFLFLGGFMVALAMEKWNVHRRIALRILLLFGARPRRILLGFMVATAFLSMWISNTATTMMMVPIVLAIVLQMEESMGKEKVGGFDVAVLLGIAYAASIGGMATLVGTPPNPAFISIFEVQFPDAPTVDFAQWFIFALPLTVIILAVAWVLLILLFLRKKGGINTDSQLFREEYHKLGRISFEEGVVLADFTILALLWLTRKGLHIGNIKIPGWSELFSHPGYINDGTVAIAMAVLLFIIPAKKEKGAAIMDWHTARKLPWNIILLFGGGFALAQAFKVSGLSEWVGQQLASIGGLHPLIIIFIICIIAMLLTEMTSNTATTQMILPILAGLAVAIKVNPLLLMVPATLSCSCAFMLPVATPPNAIIFGTQRLRIATMARTGVLLNLISAVVITLGMYFWGDKVMDIDLNTMPAWAQLEQP